LLVESLVLNAAIVAIKALEGVAGALADSAIAALTGSSEFVASEACHLP